MPVTTATVQVGWQVRTSRTCRSSWPPQRCLFSAFQSFCISVALHFPFFGHSVLELVVLRTIRIVNITDPSLTQVQFHCSRDVVHRPRQLRTRVTGSSNILIRWHHHPHPVCNPHVPSQPYSYLFPDSSRLADIFFIIILAAVHQILVVLLLLLFMNF